MPLLTKEDIEKEIEKEVDEKLNKLATYNKDIVQIITERKSTIDSAYLRFAQDNLSTQANDLIFDIKKLFFSLLISHMEALKEEIENNKLVKLDLSYDDILIVNTYNDSIKDTISIITSHIDKIK